MKITRRVVFASPYNSLMPDPVTHNRPTQHDGKVHGVIVGVRRDDGRWLVIRRSEKVAAPLRIAFPGGAQEPGEDRALAAAREFREEIGVDVRIVKHVWHHVSPRRPLILWGYLGKVDRLDDLRPCGDEVAEVLFLTADELAAHPDALEYSDAFARSLDAAAATLSEHEA